MASAITSDSEPRNGAWLVAARSPLPLSVTLVYEVWNPAPAPACRRVLAAVGTMRFVDRWAESFLAPVHTECGELAG